VLATRRDGRWPAGERGKEGIDLIRKLVNQKKLLPKPRKGEKGGVPVHGLGEKKDGEPPGKNSRRGVRPRKERTPQEIKKGEVPPERKR